MPLFHVILQGELSALTHSESVDVDVPDPEIYGDDLKSQLSVVLAAKNPRDAEEIIARVRVAGIFNGSRMLNDDIKISHGEYILKSIPSKHN